MLFREAKDNGWLAGNGLLDADGVQKAALSYPHLSDVEIFATVERFYRRFYFRPRRIAEEIFNREFVENVSFALTSGIKFLRAELRGPSRRGRDFGTSG